MPNIVDTAVQAGSFLKLVSALKAAGLTETLAGKGPWTVFAPSDEAFSKLPTGTWQSLLGNKQKLINILKYHVVSGRYTSNEIEGMQSLRSLQGQELSVGESGGVMIDRAKIIKPDVETENGVIHVIDTVLMPK